MIEDVWDVGEGDEEEGGQGQGRDARVAEEARRAALAALPQPPRRPRVGRDEVSAGARMAWACGRCKADGRRQHLCSCRLPHHACVMVGCRSRSAAIAAPLHAQDRKWTPEKVFTLLHYMRWHKTSWAKILQEDADRDGLLQQYSQVGARAAGRVLPCTMAPGVHTCAACAPAADAAIALPHPDPR